MTLIAAVPHVYVYSYKVPRRPFGSARLDAELKVRTSVCSCALFTVSRAMISSQASSASAISVRFGVSPSFSQKSDVLRVSCLSSMTRTRSDCLKAMHSFVDLCALACSTRHACVLITCLRLRLRTSWSAACKHKSLSLALPRAFIMHEF